MANKPHVKTMVEKMKALSESRKSQKRNTYHRASSRIKKLVSLDTGKRGAVGELLTCADLIKRGYQVYRSVSQSSPCDIIAYDNIGFYRVEVTTAQGIYDNGNVFHPKGNKYKLKSDLLAVVLPDGNIIYESDLIEIRPYMEQQDETDTSQEEEAIRGHDIWGWKGSVCKASYDKEPQSGNEALERSV